MKITARIRVRLGNQRNLNGAEVKELQLFFQTKPKIKAHLSNIQLLRKVPEINVYAENMCSIFYFKNLCYEKTFSSAFKISQSTYWTSSAASFGFRRTRFFGFFSASCASSSPSNASFSSPCRRLVLRFFGLSGSYKLASSVSWSCSFSSDALAASICGSNETLSAFGKNLLGNHQDFTAFFAGLQMSIKISYKYFSFFYIDFN